MPQRSLLGWELGPLPASSPRLTLWGPPVGDGLMGGRGTGAGTPRGARLGPLDSQSVLSAQPRTVSGPSPRSTPRTRPPAPGAGAHSAVSPHIHVLDSYTPRARGGGQAPRHILYVPCPGGGDQCPHLLHAETGARRGRGLLEVTQPGRGEAGGLTSGGCHTKAFKPVFFNSPPPVSWPRPESLCRCPQ